MKKADLLLAQKTILARQVKMESQQIKDELHGKRASTSHGGSSLTSNGLNALRRSTGNLSSETAGHGETNWSPVSKASNSTRASQQSQVPRASSAANFTASNVLSNNNHSGSSSEQRPSSHGTEFNSKLVDELAHRSVTDRTNLRKTQAAVSKSIEELQMQQRAASSRSGRAHTSAGGSRSGSRQQTTMYDTADNMGRTGSLASIPESTHDNSNQADHHSQEALAAEASAFFMPKKKILRSDGASLHDVYLSKRGDTWGQILKAQAREDEENKIKQRQEKERKNEEYGKRLRQQVREHELQKQLGAQDDSRFAALENATSKRSDDIQRQRHEDAIRRHKQFVQNAYEDVALKEALRARALREDLTASTIMINDAKKSIAEEEEKRARERERMKAYQDRIYQENLDDIERKARNKLQSFAEDKRIIAEAERMARLNQQRKEEELAARMKRSTEGPAHHIVQKIVELKKEEEENLYGTLFRAENSLNKQLYTSEQMARMRAQSNGDSLTDEWQKNAAYKAQKKAEDGARNARIQQTMAEMLAQQEAADRAKREAQRQQALAYQRALDQQVNELRQRSFDSLQKTMSEAEKKYNADLIRKTGALLNIQ